MNAADPFEAIVGEHYESLFRFALSLTRQETDAQDLTQHTFYVWAKKGHQMRDFTKVKTWLFTTMHRAFLEIRRRQVRFPHDDVEEIAEQLPDLAPEPADQADGAQVISALARVDEVYQAAVALFYLEDCSYKDIAAILDVPIGTVKSRIVRGIGQLRKILLSEDRVREGGDSRWNFNAVRRLEPVGDWQFREGSPPCSATAAMRPERDRDEPSESFGTRLGVAVRAE